MMLKIQLGHHRNKVIFKCNNISQYYSIFDQRHATLEENDFKYIQI